MVLKQLWNRCVCVIVDAAAGCIISKKILVINNANTQKQREKYKRYYTTVLRWIQDENRDATGRNAFSSIQGKRVAIYGMSALGLTLRDALENVGIDVVYGIDKKANYKFCGMPVYYPDQDKPDVDIVIVTILEAYDSIRDELINNGIKCVVSLEDIV